MYNFDDWYDRGVLLAQQLKKSISDFNEADHPRDESGRFTSKGEGEKKDLKKYGESAKINLQKTRHSKIRQKQRNIFNKDIHIAIREPLHIEKTVIDKKGRKSQKIIGKYTTVIINPDKNQIITVYKTKLNVRKKILKDKE